MNDRTIQTRHSHKFFYQDVLHAVYVYKNSMGNERSFPQQHHLYSVQFMVVSNALWQLSARYYALVQALGLFFHFVLFFREDRRRSVFAAKETEARDAKESGPMGKSRLFVQVSDFLFAFALPRPFCPIGKPHEFRAADATPDPGCIELKTLREMHPSFIRLRRLILSVLIGRRSLFLFLMFTSEVVEDEFFFVRY